MENNFLLESMAWGDVKHTDPIEHPVEIRNERCNLCLQECFRKCVQEHPDWFTPKTKVTRADKRDKVREYLKDNAKRQSCMVFEYTEYIGYDGDTEETFMRAICAGHLAVYMDEIFKKSQNKISKPLPNLLPKNIIYEQTYCSPGKHLGMGGGYTETCEVCGKNIYS